MRSFFNRTCFCLFFLAGLASLAQAQEPFRSGKLYIKLNAGMVFPAFLKDVYVLDRGYIIEPAIKIGLGPHVFLNAVYGYNKVGKRTIYEDFDYTNEGSHYKAGVEYLFLRPRKERGIGLSAGLNGTYAMFTESGTAIIKGPYFGNLEKDFTQSNLEAFSLEHSFNLWIVMSKRFTLIGQVRINWITSQSQNEQFPVYYIPGAGALWQPNEARANDKSVNLTGGVNVQLFYRLF